MKAQAKKGVASLYIVIFATILFGVITVSFTRIILSEVAQSSNDDLSRSAYDSALAGVEDAKIAINRYYECVADLGAESSECEKLNVFSEEVDCENGFLLAKVLHGVDNGEVKIQEVTDNTSDTAYDQAYTCVFITDVTEDYRDTLTSDTRAKIVPINIVSNGVVGGDLGNIAKIRFSWYSELNQGVNNSSFSLASDGKLQSNGGRTVPPTIQVTLIKTPVQINLNEFHVEGNRLPSDTLESVINSTMVLLPGSNEPDVITDIGSDEVADAGDVTKTHTPFSVNCTTGREFACVADIEVGPILKASAGGIGNVILVVSLPYGDSYCDFSVTLLSQDGSSIGFKGAQVSVDSTGRTNDLFRRVEVRLDPADLYFPYPQYALELTGSADEASLSKYFWITSNCWTDEGPCLNNGNL